MTGRGAGGTFLRHIRLGALALASLPPRSATAAFERIPLDAWSAALGGVVAVSGDPVFGNPAVVAPPRRAWRAAFDVARPFGLPELSEAQVGIASRGNWALGVRRFGSEAYAETEARAVLSRRHSPATLGGAVRMLQVHGTGFTARRSAAVDIGLAWELDPGMVVAAVAEATLGALPGEGSGKDRRTAFGAVRRLGDFRLVTELQRRGPGPLTAVLGVGWEPRPDLRLAVGAREDPASASAGLSLPVPGAVVALAGTWTPPLGTTFRLGIRLGAPGAETGPGATP